MLKQVIISQLHVVLKKADDINPFQSGSRFAFGMGHAPPPLTDDLFQESYRGYASLLIALDLSAAFSPRMEYWPLDGSCSGHLGSGMPSSGVVSQPPLSKQLEWCLPTGRHVLPPGPSPWGQGSWLGGVYYTVWSTLSISSGLTNRVSHTTRTR